MKLLAGSQSKMTIVLIKKGNLDTVMNKGKRMGKKHTEKPAIYKPSREEWKRLFP